MTLHSRHEQLIRESAIDSEVVQERGYRTVETKAELKRLGFAENQARAPALLIPIHGVSGDIVNYQIRPDSPRVAKGKALKYETTKGSKMALDVPPRCLGWLADPSIALFITEGARKADSGASKGLCTIALLGVWNWRGTNEVGGKAALADWESVPVNGRDVYLVFDSDVMTKVQVHSALGRLKGFLESRKARVHVIYLPVGDGAAKVGLDDYFAAGATVDELMARASSDLRDLPEGARPQPYEEVDGRIVWNQQTRDGEAQKTLTNFTARITAEVEESDGVEITRKLELTVVKSGRERAFDVSAQTFGSMSWVMDKVGAGAILAPGQSVRDHARAAIQYLSGEIPTIRAYTHTGWTEIDGQMAYVHAGGSIGHIGHQRNNNSRLPDQLRACLLPDPPSGKELVEAIRAELRFLELAPPRVVYPIWSALWRAPMGDTDVGMHLAGATGTFKTQLAALAQAHWGAEFTGQNLPGCWSSTENALEMLAFTAKDALMVVDDFAPAGSPYDIQRLHKAADRLFRAQGNHSGRLRLRRDSTLAKTHPPRGMVLSTGEDIPAGQSIRARVIVVEIARGDVNTDILTECQERASGGTFAEVMSAFLMWLSLRHKAFKQQLHDRSQSLRSTDGPGAHARTPANIASLQSGIELYLAFAQDVGALSPGEAEDLRLASWNALREQAELQQAHQNASEPTAVFLSLLSNALSAGRAHLCETHGETPSPDRAAALGWQKATVGQLESWRPQGLKVGWVEGGDVFLLPPAAHKAAQGMASETDRLTIGEKTLGKRLWEKGLLVSREPGGKYTVRKSIDGGRPRVLHLRGSSLGFGVQCVQSGQTPALGAEKAVSRPPNWDPVGHIHPFSGPEDVANDEVARWTR